MGYLLTSESVSEGHPDKVADQISDALLDEFLRWDPESKVACETMVTTGLVICSGEVHTIGYVEIERVARDTIRRIGYTKSDYRFDSESCGVITTIHDQAPDIRQGVVKEQKEEQGAGDQGMMFGYATREMDNFMPMPIEVAHILLQELAAIRREGNQMTYLRPDSKSQVTIEYDDDHHPLRVDTIVVSTQHDEFGGEKEMHRIIENDIRNILIPRAKATMPARIGLLFRDDFKLWVNPTGKFVIGGPHGDTGLTGRKIIVDTYGGKCPHGGGAFSGKDASKVDRSAAYAARHMAKNIVAAGIADEVLVQVAYAIGVAKPVGLHVDTFGTCRLKNNHGESMKDSAIALRVQEIFDMRPFAIVERFRLKNPVFLPSTTYGHFGRDPFTAEVEVYYQNDETYTKMVNGKEKIYRQADFFAWEKLDYVDILKKEFKI